MQRPEKPAFESNAHDNAIIEKNQTPAAAGAVVSILWANPLLEQHRALLEL